MRRLLLTFAFALSACGTPVAPELYNVVVDAFSLPNTCFTNSTPPTTVVSAAPPSLVQISVWDGAAGEAFVEIESGGITVDMGAAPNVVVGGLMRGTKSTSGPAWTFVADRVVTTTVPNLSTSTSKANFSLTFERTLTFKGILGLSSSRECTGVGCAGSTPSCAVSNVPVNGTRLQVDYLKSP
jgi:hypothetical protein